MALQIHTGPQRNVGEMVKDDGGSVDKGHSLTLSNITNTSTDECDEEEIDTAQSIQTESPISIRSNIPELQGHVHKRILVGNDFTWAEFIETWCEFDLDEERHCVKGKANQELDKDSLVGEYIKSFKRQLKVYPIRVEMRRKSTKNRKKVTTPEKDAPVISHAEDEDIVAQVEVQNEDCMEGESYQGISGDSSVLSDTTLPPNPEAAKSSIIQYLTTKVSNNDLLLVRQELMNLRRDNDFFKITSLVPMAAGLLDQMLCDPKLQED